MASELSGYIPQPIDNYTGYRNHLIGLLQARQTKGVPGCTDSTEDNSDPVDPNDVVFQNIVTNVPAQEGIGKTIEVSLCPTCGQRGHLVHKGPSVVMSPTPNSDIKGNHEIFPIGPNAPLIDKTSEGTSRPHTRLMSQQVMLRSPGMIPESSKHPKKRTVSALGTSGEEDIEGPIHTTSNKDSEHEEALLPQIKVSGVGESPSNGDPTHNTEPQNKGGCSRSFLEV